MPANATKAPISRAAGKLGERVKAARLDMGMTQEALAEHTGLHWSYIGQVERGQNNPTLYTLLALAQVLQVDPGALVAGLAPPTEKELKQNRALRAEAAERRRRGARI